MHDDRMWIYETSTSSALQTSDQSAAKVSFEPFPVVLQGS